MIKQLLVVGMLAMFASGCEGAAEEAGDDLAEESSELQATKRLYAGEGAYIIGAWRSRVLFARRVDRSVEIHVASRSGGDRVLGLVPSSSSVRSEITREGRFVLYAQFAPRVVVDVTKAVPTFAVVPGTEYAQKGRLSAQGDYLYAEQREGISLGIFLRRATGTTYEITTPAAPAGPFGPVEITDDGQRVLYVATSGDRYVHSVTTRTATALPGGFLPAARAGNRLYAVLPRRDGGSDLSDVTRPDAPETVYSHELHPILGIVPRPDGLLATTPTVQLVDPVARRLVAQPSFRGPSTAVLDRRSTLSPDGNYFVSWTTTTAWLHALRPSGYVVSRVLDGIGEMGFCKFEGAFLWCERSDTERIGHAFAYRNGVVEVRPGVIRGLEDPSTHQTCWLETSTARAADTQARCVSEVGVEVAVPAPYAVGAYDEVYFRGSFLFSERNLDTQTRQLVAFDPATRSRTTLHTSGCGGGFTNIGAAVTSSRLFFADCAGVYAR